LYPRGVAGTPLIVKTGAMAKAMSWLNEPPQWSDRAGVTSVRTGL
jgi:hypothetical protein